MVFKKGFTYGKVERKFNYFGKSNWAGEENLHGIIDDFKIFNIGLNQSEILDEM
jgi:hypothetical protein